MFHILIILSQFATSFFVLGLDRGWIIKCSFGQSLFLGVRIQTRLQKDEVLGMSDGE
jgi:hypothetical protein